MKLILVLTLHFTYYYAAFASSVKILVNARHLIPFSGRESFIRREF